MPAAWKHLKTPKGRSVEYRSAGTTDVPRLGIGPKRGERTDKWPTFAYRCEDGQGCAVVPPEKPVDLAFLGDVIDRCIDCRK